MHNRRRVISGPNIVLPSQIGSVAAWYRYGQGITQAGGFASAWADQSGNGRNLTQGVGVNQPSVNADGSLRFDGSAQYLRALFTLPQPTTVVGLVRQLSWTAGDRIWDGGTGNMGLSQSPSSARVAVIAATALTGNSLNDPVLNTYGVYVAVYNGASSVGRVDNGVEATGDIGASTPAGFTLGAQRTIAGYANIDVKEAIVFSIALNATQRQLMVNYLASVGNLVI